MRCAAHYARAMRHLSSALRFGAALLLAACGDDPADSTRKEPAPVEAQPRCVLPEAELSGEIEIRGARWWDVELGACGHVAVPGRGLFGPDLQPLSDLPDVSLATFSPTGEGLLLRLQYSDELAYMDLATGETQQLGTAIGSMGFAPRRDRTGSLLWFCHDDTLFVFEQGERRPLVDGASCVGWFSQASAAPVLAYSTASRIAVIDLETGALRETDLPPIARFEAGQLGVLGLSPDGTKLVHQRELEVDERDEPLSAPEPIVSVVDLATGDITRVAIEPSVQFIVPVPVPGSPGAIAWNHWGEGPTTIVHENGDLVAITEHRLLSLAGPIVLGYRALDDGYVGWDWIDLRTGRADPVAEIPPTYVGPHGYPVGRFVVSNDGRAFALAESESGPTRVYAPAKGWRTVPWHVTAILDDGSLLTDTPTAWREPDGTLIAAFAGEFGGVREHGNRAFAHTAGYVYLLDKNARKVRALGKADPLYRLTDDGKRIALEIWRREGQAIRVRTL